MPATAPVDYLGDACCVERTRFNAAAHSLLMACVEDIDYTGGEPSKAVTTVTFSFVMRRVTTAVAAGQPTRL